MKDLKKINNNKFLKKLKKFMILLLCNVIGKERNQLCSCLWMFLKNKKTKD